MILSNDNWCGCVFDGNGGVAVAAVAIVVGDGEGNTVVAHV